MYEAVIQSNVPITFLLIKYVLTDERLGDLKQRQAILQEWINRKMQDQDNYTVMHAAASSDNYLLLQLLLSHGGDLHAVSGSGQTLLHEATRECQAINAAIVHKLGINIDVRDED